jgi:DNA-binding PadR family transcriptional regulator
MTIELEDCPCTGKNMSNLAAPWVLLTLYRREGIHGYEITRIIRDHIEALGIGLNMTGLYRHLNVLEDRGMLASQWDTSAKGPARRRYRLTEAGRQCLWQWMQTLTTQMMLIGKFFDHARAVFPDSDLPGIVVPQPSEDQGAGSERRSQARFH